MKFAMNIKGPEETMTIDTPTWVKDAVFYLIFPDRFAASSRVVKPPALEPWNEPPTTYGFKGGDLLGIAEHLDYLQELGVSALLLNPIFSSAANHRYHTINYFEVDPILGGNTAFKELVEELKRRKMRLVLDGVFNHTGRGFYQFMHALENGIKSPYLNWFHFNIPWLQAGRPLNAFPPQPICLPNHDDNLSLEGFGYKSWWNLPALPKLNTASQEVREFIFEVARHWIEQGADGWRLDVPSEINDNSFWRTFRQVVKKANPDAYIVGEIWEDASRWLQGDQFDAVMNYLFTKALLGFICGDSLALDLLAERQGLSQVRRLSAAEFKQTIEGLLARYSPAVNEIQLNLLGSHDTPRILTMTKNNLAVVKLAALFLFTYPGAPCIYYGDEIGLQGGHDPACRAAFPWDTKSWNMDLLNTFRRLIELRKAHPALRYGSYQSLYAEGDVYVYRRNWKEKDFIIILNRGHFPQTVFFQAKDLSSMRFKDLLAGESIIINKSGSLETKIEPFSALLLSSG